MMNCSSKFMDPANLYTSNTRDLENPDYNSHLAHLVSQISAAQSETNSSHGNNFLAKLANARSSMQNTPKSSVAINPNSINLMQTILATNLLKIQNSFNLNANQTNIFANMANHFNANSLLEQIKNLNKNSCAITSKSKYFKLQSFFVLRF